MCFPIIVLSLKVSYQFLLHNIHEQEVTLGDHKIPIKLRQCWAEVPSTDTAQEAGVGNYMHYNMSKLLYVMFCGRGQFIEKH